MKPQVYLVVIIVIAILATFLGKRCNSDTIAALGTNPEEVQQLAAREAEICRQRAVIADTLLHEVRLRWENSLAPRTAKTTLSVLCDARDENDRARLYLNFQMDGRIHTISLAEREGSHEGRLTPQDAERVAGAWLNRLHELMPGPWHPLGQHKDSLGRNTVFSRWQAPGCIAFIGIDCVTGMPRLIIFRYFDTISTGDLSDPPVVISPHPFTVLHRETLCRVHRGDGEIPERPWPPMYLPW